MHDPLWPQDEEDLDVESESKRGENMDKITIIRPDDFHVHLRDGYEMQAVLPHSMRYAGRVMAMPNLDPPLTTTQNVLEYQRQIMTEARLIQEHNSHVSKDFYAIVPLYATDDTTAEEVELLSKAIEPAVIKVYMAGATTNSQYGIKNIENLYPALEKAEELGVVVSWHGEIDIPDISIFDRERAFINSILDSARNKFPKLKMVLEHITTGDGCQFVAMARNMAGTITPHHLVITTDNIFKGGLNPHNYCLPIAKTKRDRYALIDCAINCDNVFMGTDSAPHSQHSKMLGKAGCYTAYSALEIYAEVFEYKLNKLEEFTSKRGAEFYGLKPNTETVTLVKETYKIPSDFPYHSNKLIPFLAGGTVGWKIQAGA